VTDLPLEIIHYLAPGAYGGAEAVVRMLADGQARRDHHVRVALTLEGSSGEHPLEAQLRDSPLDLLTWRLPARAYRREATLLRALCAERRPDVVHSHGYRSDVLASQTMRQRSAALVSTAHGFTGGGTKNRFYEWLQRRAYSRFDAVVAVSQSVADRLVSNGVARNRVHLVPNAWIPTREPLPRAQARQELGLPAEGCLVGWVGRLSEEKGPDVLIDAIPSLAGAPAQFVFVGAGPGRAQLESRTVALGVDQRVSWIGGVPDAGRYFRAFDVFVLSSRTEGTPIVLFEAMAAGVPIVATRVGGVPEMLSPGEAMLVSPSDPVALAQAIHEVISDPEKGSHRARAASARLATDHDPEMWLSAHEKLYRSVAGHRTKTPTDEDLI